MDKAHPRARFDWLVELGGALASGLAAGFAALKLAPSFAWQPAAAMIASGSATFGCGWLLMRAVSAGPREHGLAGFSVAPIETVPCEEPLLLDVRYEEPLLLEDLAENEALLLDDPLCGPGPDSRVVQLFAHPPIPTPGQLKERIDRHLATGTMHAVHEYEGPAPDASDELYAALAELRRSLR